MLNTKVLHFANIWENVSDIIPDIIAVLSGNKTKTLKEYEDTSSRIASFLHDQGIKEYSQIGFYLHNGNDYL